MDGGSLASVGLAPGSREAADGLVSVRHPPKQLSVDEACVVRGAQAFRAVDYVFFRRFDDGSAAQPAAFVIDNSTERFTEVELAKTHHDLWLHGVVPLVYIAWPTRIDVLSCARGPDFWYENARRYKPAERLEVASQVESAIAKRRRFSARRLADGTFWEERLNQPLADYEKAAHESLIQSVVKADSDLGGKKHPVYRRLLLLTILVKYLEDRGVFPSDGWFGRFRRGARTFLDVLQGGQPDEVLRLLEALERKFNGDVFGLPPDAVLTKETLRSVARLVEAKTLDGQRYLWKLYSFDHLPVEIISHLYQRFVKGSTAVYTPPFLAALLLDYAMPYGKIIGAERVLDPACGSGVFLVGAFRRLINAWRARHQWRRPDVETLKSILRNQIFGVELEPEAIDLTAFSLALAVCDTLQPKVIWTELRFDRLRGNNLHQQDFFAAASPDGDRSPGLDKPFDLIVGNPPFESQFTKAARLVNAGRNGHRGKIPDKQIAYLFLDQSMRLLSPEGRLCLIQPSNLIYGVQSNPFWRSIAATNRIESLLDFTSVRGLYKGADVKTIAVVVGERKSSRFAHLTFRRTYRTAQRIGFELDHYDRHHLSVVEVISNPSAARVNLLGGGRLGRLSDKFRQMRTLADFVKERNWLMGEGFIEGKGGKDPGEHLQGQRLVPKGAMTIDGLRPEQLETVTAVRFLRPRKPDLFEPPLILILENASLPIVYWDQSVLTFKHEIVGIHAPAEDRIQHQQVFKRLVNSHFLLQFSVILNGAQSLVGKATAVLKKDIDLLPYPESETELALAFWETVLAEDTLHFLAPYIRLGQQSELLKEAADAKTLCAYASVFCRMLGSLYDNLRASDPIFIGGLICQPFFFGDQPEIEWLGPECEEKLMQLVFEDTFASLRTARVVRFYHQNVLFIIKPDRLRYWIRSTAIRDADDTLTDLQQQGY